MRLNQQTAEYVGEILTTQNWLHQIFLSLNSESLRDPATNIIMQLFIGSNGLIEPILKIGPIWGFTS
jgi:hypothetical protein